MGDQFKFTPGECMVFHYWKNKYQPTEDYQNLFNSPWCPLFGVLPFNDPLALAHNPLWPPSMAKALIQQLRTFLGVPIALTDLCPEAYPDPEVIFELTGFSQVMLTLSRYFFTKIINSQILSYKLFTDDERNNIKLVNMSPLISIEWVRDILKRYYIDAQGNRKYADLFDKELSKVAMDMHNNSQKWGMQQGKCELAAKEREAEQKRRVSYIKSQEDGKKGYNKGIGNKHRKAHHKHEVMHQAADKIWSKQPLLTKNAVAEIIAKKTGDKVDTIRRIITRK